MNKPSNKEQYNKNGQFEMWFEDGSVCFQFVGMAGGIGIPPDRAVELGKGFIEMGLKAMTDKERSEALATMIDTGEIK